MAYLAGSVTPDDLGIDLDDSVALRLAEANVGCIDNNVTMARATTLGLGAEVDSEETALQELEDCCDETIDDSIWIENLRLQYLHVRHLRSARGAPALRVAGSGREVCTT